MSLKQSDQLALLEKYSILAETGKWEGVFTYPNCGADLVDCGLVTDDGKITMAGRAALFLAGKGADPTPASKTSITFTLPMNKAANT